MDETANGGEGSSTPSRISMAALCSPSQSPHPSAMETRPNSRSPRASNGTTNDKRIEAEEEDVEMADASQGSRVNPSRRAKVAAANGDATKAGARGNDKSDDDDDDDEEDGNFGEGGQGEGADEEDVGDDDDDEDEDDEDDEEEEEDDDDDDEDDEEEEDESDDDSVEREKSKMEGVEGAGEKAITKASQDAATETATATDASGGALTTGANSTVKVNGSSANGEKASVKKKHFKRRSPSVEEVLPTGPPPRPSVRLKFTLCKTEDDPYMTNIPEEIYKILKGKDDAWAQWYESTMPNESVDDADEDDDDVEGEGTNDSNADLRSEFGGLARLLEKYPSALPKSNGKGAAGKVKSGKGKKSDLDYEIGDYDTRDPFVDDSELNVDEPTYSAKPSADGFFVAEGEIELQEAERNKVIATGQEALAAAGRRGQIPPDFGQMEGDAGGAGALFLELGPTTSDVTIVNTMLSRYAAKFGILPNEGDVEPPAKIKSLLNESEKPIALSPARQGSRESPIKVDDDDAEASRPDVPFQPIQPVKYPVERVSRRLEDEFIKLRQMAAKESWLKKSKFPPDLRDPLINACRIAIASNEFNENFFNWLPQIFPYNRLTLNKYVRRQVYADHTGYMKQLMELNEQGFKRQIDELYPRLKKEYDEASAAWSARGSREGTPNEATGGVGGDEPSVNEKANEGGEAAADGEEEAPVNKNAKPVKRWQWTELFRETLFTIITIDNAITALKKEKNDFENVQEKISTINQRKDIYKRLLELWPEKGWTTTTALSNQHGLYKRKVEKFAQMVHGITPGGVQDV